MNLLTAKEITKIYTDKNLFTGADFSIEEKDKVGIVGINGTGKSTLLRILAGIEDTREWGTVLRVRGADLMDGTPILDVKPYLPYADCRPEALGGFAAAAPDGEALAVECPAELWEKVPPDRREALRAVLALDPRPRYQEDPERVYGFGFAGLEARFSVEGRVLRALEIENGPET